MNKRTDLVLVSFLQDHEEGRTFIRSRHNGWPLHITLFPWFGVSDAENLKLELANLVKSLAPFEVKVGAEKMFGVDQNIPVNVIEDQTKLKQLHNDLADFIVSNGEVLEARWTQDGYNAHVTQHVGADNVAEGTVITIDHIYLVRLVNESTCLLLKKYSFGGNHESKT